MKRSRLTVLVLWAASMTTGASCYDRPPRAPFLCCVLTCTGGLREAQKEVPESTDAGWRCERGEPIDYEATCTSEEGFECDEDTTQNTSGGTTESGSSSSTAASQ